MVRFGEVSFMNLIIPDFQSHSLEGKLKSDEVWYGEVWWGVVRCGVVGIPLFISVPEPN